MEQEARKEALAAEEAAAFERRKRNVAFSSIQGFLVGKEAVPLPESTAPPPKAPETAQPAPTSEFPAVPQSALPLDSKYRFVPPPTASALPSARPMPPPSAFPGRWGIATPFAPVSGMPGISPFTMPVVPPGLVWRNPLDATAAPKGDKVVLTRSRASKSSFTNPLANSSGGSNKTARPGQETRSLDEWLKPYKPDIVGPEPPTEQGDPYRWCKLMEVFLKTVVQPMRERPLSPETSMRLNKEFMVPEGVHFREGLSHALLPGAVGISPSTHLYRALEDSRCFLFNPHPQ